MATDRKLTPPGPIYAALRVFDLSLGEMLWSRRTIFMALVVGLPVLLAGVIRMLHTLNVSGMRVNNVALNGPMIFGLMIWVFFVRFCVPVLGVFYGTALIADEVEDKTITYLFTRPIGRGAVLVGKYLAYLVCTVFVVLPSITLGWLLVIPIGGSLGANFIDLVKDLGLTALGLAVYGAVFAFIGASIKRPLLVGLLFSFGLEPALMVLPGYLKHFTVAYYLQGLVPQAMPTDSAVSIFQAIFHEAPGITESLGWLTVMVVGFLWLASRIVSGREYVLEQ